MSRKKTITRLAHILAVLACLGTFVALLINPPTFLLLWWIIWFLATFALAAFLWSGRQTMVFVSATLVTFAFVGVWATIFGGSGQAAMAESVNPEAGEALYWSRGKCSTCHSMGDRGSATRGPNHENVCGKARDQRLAERQAAGETGIQTATDYLVESIAQPDAYVVEGYSPGMPKVYLRPVSLTPDEIRAVVMYLQTQGCEPDATAINLSSEIIEAARAEAPTEEQFTLVVSGDPAAGQVLFFDAEGPAACVKCHTYAGEGEEVGPELTGVASVQTLEYIFESIMDPNAQIAAGDYEPIQVRLKDKTILPGILRDEDDATVTIKDKEGIETVVDKSDIDRELRYPDVPSIMPDNFGELLTVKQVADLMAFLQQPSFQQDVMPILVQQCLRCHSDDAPHSGLRLTDYESVMKGSLWLPIVQPGVPEDSPIYLMTSKGTMPAESEPLNKAEVQAIHDWITAGAPNN